ncbi:putative alpha-galactosidase A [Rosellinia necatrix]|uniref:Putative alpha-galactosidase A n=1 Tax=Rosellinia necatrix TaxID=77044 RepID=A0A1S8A8E2_ROSNE|nr:putative alpha-galactosidase A [Rosellinia necatrix]
MELPQLISMEVSRNGRCDYYYRILVNRRVRYITVMAGALDAEALGDMPLDFQSILPSLPYDKYTWNSACIARDLSSGQLEATLLLAELPGVETMEAETHIHQVVEGQGIAPEFLGHAHEAGRVIGFLLEKVVDGRNAESSDLEICRATLRRFRALGFVHGTATSTTSLYVRTAGLFLLISTTPSLALTPP